MAKIRARGYLIAGVDQSTYHFGYLNPLHGQIEGFDIDMVHAVAEAIFGNPNKVEFKAISDAERIPDVRSGAVDIVAHTMTINCARLQQVDFSTVYFDAGQRVLVLKNSRVKSLADLGGKRVCATAGSTSIANIKAAPSHPIPVAVPYWTDCLVLLQQGDVAAISTDDSILAGLAAQDPWTKIVGPRFTSEPYGLAISKQHPDFVRFVNAVLQQMRTDGQWAASYAHWVGTPVPAPPPPSTRSDPWRRVTREQAAAAVAAATAERDGIQANLLDLDGSFGKRMLAGATLTGESKLRWEAAAADLATLWETFTAYAAVVDQPPS